MATPTEIYGLIAESLRSKYLAQMRKPDKKRQLELLKEAVAKAWSHLPAETKAPLEKASLDELKRPEELKPEIKAPWEKIVRRLQLEGLARATAREAPGLAGEMEHADLLKRLKKARVSLSREHRASAARGAVYTLAGGKISPKDIEAIRALIKEVGEMATRYFVDNKAAPDDWKDEHIKAFLEAVEHVLKEHCNFPKAGNEVKHAAIAGMLLRAEVYDYKGVEEKEVDPYLRQKACEFFLKLASNQTQKADGSSTSWFEVYVEIDKELDRILPSDSKRISYQALAAVGEYVLSRLNDYPLGAPNFSLCVERGLEAYVSQPKKFQLLDLPKLTGEQGAEDEIEKDNIQALAICYMSHQLEQVRLFDTADRLTELFMNGLLPVGLDEGGRALDSYYWKSQERMNSAARLGLYSRLFGVPGGDVSQEVRPNSEFETLWMRFLASVSEYRRQKRESLAGSRRVDKRPLYLTDDYVRKAGRDLAGNLSLFGWAGTHFAARRLSSHIKQAIDLLKSPPVLKAYGANNIWQLIEQVASREFGQAPNVVRYRTMAEAGQAIMNLLARKHVAWSADYTKLLFPDPMDLNKTAHFTESEEDELARWVESWLAVNGIKSEEVDNYSQPAETITAASMPSYGGGATGGESLEQLKQMVAAGQAPTLDQLKGMLPAA